VANGYSGLAYGQSQKNPSPRPPGRWTISLIKATPAKYLGQVFATNEAEAIKEAVKEFNVAENLRDRLMARKENY